MDDKRFDDIIRGKAERYQDTGHDEHALSDFKKRLDSLPSKKSRSNLSKTGYLLGAMALFTLINFGIVWYFSEGRYTALNHEIGQLKEERAELIKSRESSQMLLPQKSRTDTVYIYQRFVTKDQGLTKAAGQNAGSPDQFITLKSGKGTTRHYQQHYSWLGADSALSQELKTFLRDNQLVLEGENGELLLVVNHTPTVIPVNNYMVRDHHYAGSSGAPRYLKPVDTYEIPESSKPSEKKQISNKMLWALEKHNQGGIDFQFGLEGKYHQSNFDVGKGERNGGIGIMAEAIFSPTWRLETGIHLGARAYKISSDQIEELPPSFFDDYPGYDNQLGELNSLESDALLVKIPLNLKRFAPLDHNKRWFVSAGLTPQWTRKQEFEYRYAIELPDPPDRGEFVSFVGSKQEVSGSYYTTTINLGLGTEVYLNERLRWQLGLFYQKGLGDAGYENRQLENSYGIKSSIWFNNP